MEITNVERLESIGGDSSAGFQPAAFEVPGFRSTQRAVCELCGDVITTTNGGRRMGPVFVPFERLLEMHMEQQHPNLSVLPPREELRPAA